MVNLPLIGLGTGGDVKLSGAKCIDVVRSAFDIGYRHIDTAEYYNNEEDIGNAIATSSIHRDDLILSTKIDSKNLGYESVLKSGRDSAERLGVETIDLLYVHFPRDTYDPAETIPAFCELVEKGVISNIGVSNFSPDQVEEALEFASEPIVANQIELHPLFQRPDFIEHAAEHDMTIVSYCPLAQGEIFGVPELVEIAEKYDVTEADVTLAWLTDMENVVTIPKSTSTDHLRSNLEASALSLDSDDLSLIESIETEYRVYS